MCMDFNAAKLAKAYSLDDAGSKSRHLTAQNLSADLWFVWTGIISDVTQALVVSEMLGA